MNGKTFFLKSVTFGLFLALASLHANAQVKGKFGTYYDQRELLFESLPTSESDIIFLGNSITDGGEWAELFQNPHCKNRGISGDVCAGVSNRLKTITEGKPAMVFLMIGVNDMARNHTPEEISDGIVNIVRQIKEESPKTRIIVQSVLPVNDCYNRFADHGSRWETVPAINQLVREKSEMEGVDYLDLYRHFANEEGKLDTLYTNDGLHLNGAGYQLWKTIVEECYGPFPKPVYTSKLPIWINLGLGSVVPRLFEQGASPLRYTGYGVNFNVGATVEWDRYHLQADARGLAGVLINRFTTSIYDICFDFRAEFLYLLHETPEHHLRWWAGVAAQEFLDLCVMPQLMNASTAVSNFTNLRAEGMLQYDFAPFYDGSHNLFSLYGKLSLPVVAGVNRPGYAYMDNYTSDLYTVGAVLQNYDHFLMFFPGVSTDVGISINLLNNNKITLSYQWDYFTTRHHGNYRFDHASHAFMTTYMFNLY